MVWVFGVDGCERVDFHGYFVAFCEGLGFDTGYHCRCWSPVVATAATGMVLTDLDQTLLLPTHIAIGTFSRRSYVDTR